MNLDRNKTVSLTTLFALLLVALLPVLPARASSWVARLGGPWDDEARTVVAAGDGGYLAAGSVGYYEDDHGVQLRFRDLLIYKLDAQGNVQWTKVMGGPLDDEAFGACQTSDGGFAVAGTSYNFDHYLGGGLASPWLIRLDASGNVLWQQWYKTPAPSFASYATAVVQTQDGGFALGGAWWDQALATHPFVFKVDSAGTPVWEHLYSDANPAVAGTGWPDKIVAAADGGIVFAGGYGQIQSGGTDVYGEYAAKLTTGGELLWAKGFGSTSYYVTTSTVSDVLANPDGSIVLVGAPDGRLMKLDSSGAILWVTRLLPPSVPDIRPGFSAVARAQGGSYYASGTYLDYRVTDFTGEGPLFIALSEDGAVKWQEFFSLRGTPGSPTTSWACAGSDGGVVAAGDSFGDGNDCFVMKLETEGSLGDGCLLPNDPGLAWTSDPGVAADVAWTSNDAPCASAPTAKLPKSTVLDAAKGFCPVITGVTVLQNPFRLDVTGQNFFLDPGAEVKIDGVSPPDSIRKNTREIIVKKGAALKAMVPKGQAVCITVESEYPGTSYKSPCYTFTR